MCDDTLSHVAGFDSDPATYPSYLQVLCHYSKCYLMASIMQPPHGCSKCWKGLCEA